MNLSRKDGPITSRPVVLIGTNLRDHAVAYQFAELARQLSAGGWDVRLLVHGGHARPEWLYPGAKILNWPSPRPTRLADGLFFSRLVRQLRPACVIANFGATAIMMNIGALHRVPVRIFWHHTLSSAVGLDWPHSQLWLRLVRLRARSTFRLATHAVGNSQAAKDDLIATYGVPEKRISVFWNALRDPLTHASSGGGHLPSRENASLKIVCAGRFAFTKGQDLLLQALPRVLKQFPGVSVEFIGVGGTLEQCKNDATRLGLNGHCLFRGGLPHDQVLACMATACLTVVPSRSEAFGLVNIESMALGAPVVASRTGGITEIIRDGVDGLLFPPGDHQALAECLLKLLGDLALRSRMSANCRARFLEHFEVNRAAKAQAQWLCGLIAPTAEGLKLKAVARPED